MDLLTMFKISIGVLDTDTSLDWYYTNLLNMATADLASDDISVTVLDTEIGKVTVVLYAELLMNQKDIATNPTLILLKNKLSAMTKGERVTDV